METTAYIGKTIRIKGAVTAEEPFTIAGTVEGTVTVTGHALTVTVEGTLNADATADTILVEGAVKGSLTATTRMTLKSTATVEGEIHTPALSVADGATIQGRVTAGAGKKTLAA